MDGEEVDVPAVPCRPFDTLLPESRDDRSLTHTYISIT